MINLKRVSECLSVFNFWDQYTYYAMYMFGVLCRHANGHFKIKYTLPMPYTTYAMIHIYICPS